MVRLAATRKRCLADPRRIWLYELMAQLQIRHRPGGAEPEFHGSLEELSIALVGDARFRIDGVASDREEAGGAGPVDLGVIELLAHERRSESTPPMPMAELLHFQISVWREGEDSYRGRLIQLRRRLTTNVGEWVASASGKRTGTMP